MCSRVPERDALIFLFSFPFFLYFSFSFFPDFFLSTCIAFSIWGLQLLFAFLLLLFLSVDSFSPQPLIPWDLHMHLFNLSFTGLLVAISGLYHILAILLFVNRFSVLNRTLNSYSKSTSLHAQLCLWRWGLHPLTIFHISSVGEEHCSRQGCLMHLKWFALLIYSALFL